MLSKKIRLYAHYVYVTLDYMLITDAHMFRLYARYVYVTLDYMLITDAHMLHFRPADS